LFRCIDTIRVVIQIQEAEEEPEVGATTHLTCTGVQDKLVGKWKMRASTGYGPKGHDMSESDVGNQVTTGTS